MLGLGSLDSLIGLVKDRIRPGSMKLLCCMLLSAVMASACSVAPRHTAEPVQALIRPAEAAAAAPSAADARLATTGIGVALAGGGTKAASYAMGVLAAISDEDMFGRIDAISTVSGGGYAAFFLYSKVLARRNDTAAARPALSDFFADCIPRRYAKKLPAASSHRLCAAEPEDATMEKYRFQQFVRCRQDVLENDCNQELEGTDHSEIANAVVLAAGTVVALVPNFVARTLFDWPVNMSPSRYAYLEGIGTAYGLYPVSIKAASKSRDLLDHCEKGRFLNCDASSGYARLDRRALRFDDLAAYHDSGAEKVPVWIINATASRSRSLFGWAREGQRDFTQYTLQMSPFTARSGFHGKVGNYREHLDLLEATTAAAAFLDANETLVRGQPGRLGAALVQHALAFDWGVDIPNPNVDAGWRALHSVLPLWPWPWTTLSALPTLPIPMYWADGGLRQLGGAKPNQRSPYIRLLDGGNNDDLGTYTLIEAGKKHIVISDHAYDGKGDMQDLCRLHNEVRLRMTNKKLVVPGLKGFAEHCLQFVRESECVDQPCKSVPGLDEKAATKGGYPITGWKHPVLLGCIRDLGSTKDSNESCDGRIDTQLYILKPALNLAEFVDKYLPGGTVDVKACPEAGKNDSGATASDSSDNKDLGVCEVAAYIASQKTDAQGFPILGAFPQHSTVGMTFASTGREYGAYRELARWQARQALRLVLRSEAAPSVFAEEAANQRKDAIGKKGAEPKQP